MPRHGTFPTDAGKWVEGTAHNATSVTFQNQGERRLRLKGTDDDQKPDDDDFDGSIIYDAWLGETNIQLADLFPGLPGVVRVWIWCTADQEFYFSHA